MFFKFHVPLKRIEDLSYDIIIGRNLMQQFAENLKNIVPAYRYALITDKSVNKLYTKPLLEQLKKYSIFPLVIECSPERNIKNSSIQSLY